MSVPFKAVAGSNLLPVHELPFSWQILLSGR